MSIISAQTDIIVVDSATALLSLLDNLVSLAVYPPSLYFDLEGVKLGRHGSISIISLYVAPIKKIYLIDIHVLGETAFSTTNSSSTSLKNILESPTIPKVIFDIRNDSDALFSHFQISVDGIQDLQLMELATRKGSKDFVAGLAKCIEKESPISAAAKAEWQHTKEGASRLYDPKKGGRYEIFNERPMRPEIIQYCARDVALLPGLYNVYNAKLRLPGEAFWQARVREATKDRIKLSQSPGYDGQAESKVRGPWNKEYIEQAIDEWNDDVLSEAFADGNEDFDFDFDNYGDDDWNWTNGTSARDCMGWEEDMIKNGEYF
jgi:exonuclease 3'-5' domain-containing protein 1